MDDNYPIIGSEASPLSVHFRDFPYIYSLFFYTVTLQSLDIDFLPGDFSKRPMEDTGFKVREKFLENGYRGKFLRIKDTSYFKSGPFKNINCQEFYLENCDRIFASHFHAGSSGGKMKFHEPYLKKVKEIKVIGKYLIKNRFIIWIISLIAGIRGWFEKYRWIAMCKRLSKIV